MSEERKESDATSGSSSSDLDSTFQLISRARNGDQQAIEQLFARHLKPLQRWASGRLPKWARDLADTDDLVQEALVQTFKRIEDFEPRRVGALQAYLRQAVINRLRDELRRKAETTGGHGFGGPGRRLRPIAPRAGDRASSRRGLQDALGRLRPEERKRSLHASRSAIATKSWHKRSASHPLMPRARLHGGLCCGSPRR